MVGEPSIWRTDATPPRYHFSDFDQNRTYVKTREMIRDGAYHFTGRNTFLISQPYFRHRCRWHINGRLTCCLPLCRMIITNYNFVSNKISKVILLPGYDTSSKPYTNKYRIVSWLWRKTLKENKNRLTKLEDCKLFDFSIFICWHNSYAMVAIRYKVLTQLLIFLSKQLV